MTPEEAAERENDPHELTRRFYSHPWWAGAACGALIMAWTLVLDAPILVAVAVGVGLWLLTGLLWRPGGPGQRIRRYVLREFPKRS